MHSFRFSLYTKSKQLLFRGLFYHINCLSITISSIKSPFQDALTPLLGGLKVASSKRVIIFRVYPYRTTFGAFILSSIYPSSFACRGFPLIFTGSFHSSTTVWTMRIVFHGDLNYAGIIN